MEKMKELANVLYNLDMAAEATTDKALKRKITAMWDEVNTQYVKEREALYNKLRHYGKILRDKEKWNGAAASRETVYEYNDKCYYVCMLDGNITSIEAY